MKVWSRRGADFTDRFVRIAEAVRGQPVDEALIDGEPVVFRDDGRSDPHAAVDQVVRQLRGPNLQAVRMWI